MTRPRFTSDPRRGFTLTELMVSIALALLLLVGVNQVFKTTALTVGTSYATLEGVRKQLATGNVFAPDFQSAVSNNEQPAIIIHSTSITQYWDKNDQDSDKDGNVYTVDLDDDGIYTLNLGEDLRPGTGTGGADLRNGRNHRTDRVSFFARNINTPFRRQTGDVKLVAAPDYTLVADETSTEVWIWYGFLRQPRDKTGNSSVTSPNLDPTGYGPSNINGDYFLPAQPDPGNFPKPYDISLNRNNYYAHDWAIGRQAILLKSEPAGDYLRGNLPSDLLAPLSNMSGVFSTVQNTTLNHPGGANWLAPHSRIDLAKTSIQEYRKTVKAVQDRDKNAVSPNMSNWYTFLDYQFNAKSWSEPAGDRGAELATTTPFLTRGCSQLIVEFAGDFVTQNNTSTSSNYGDVLKVKPDGIVDFMVIPANAPLEPNVRRTTRWYGFPRDVAGPATTLNPAGGPDGIINWRYDVAPVRDFAHAFGRSVPAGRAVPDQSVIPNPEPWFEEVYPFGDSTTVLANNFNYLASGVMASNASYVCAWGPNDLKSSATTPSTIDPNASAQPRPYPGPWMIRVILNVRDRNGRLPDGQTIEHVYDLTK